MTDTRPNPCEPQRAEQPLRLVLELKTDGDIPSGTVEPASGSPPIVFHGWVGLMSAISRLLADPPSHTATGRTTGLSIREFP